jgi:hypothetical protein
MKKLKCPTTVKKCISPLLGPLFIGIVTLPIVLNTVQFFIIKLLILFFNTSGNTPILFNNLKDGQL